MLTRPEGPKQAGYGRRTRKTNERYGTMGVMYEEKVPQSSVINCIWRAVADHDEGYTDPANEYWSLGFARHADGALAAELYGPTLRPRVVRAHKDEEYWGVEFKAHVIMRATHKSESLGLVAKLEVDNEQVLLAGRRYKIPRYDELEMFVSQLLADGVIVSDQRMYRSLHGNDMGLSERSRQRYYKQITGISKKQMEQLYRVRQAYYLLQTGKSISEAAVLAGYADQAHMTRAFKLLRGQTPARIIAAYGKEKA